MHTPTISALVREGVELHRHYAHMICTPSRSSLQTGRLPVHLITQLADPCDKAGAIPRNMTGLAEQLQRAGYATHQVGKWDAGMSTPRHTPHGRGFDTSLNVSSRPRRPHTKQLVIAKYITAHHTTALHHTTTPDHTAPQPPRTTAHRTAPHRTAPRHATPHQPFFRASPLPAPALSCAVLRAWQLDVEREGVGGQ